MADGKSGRQFGAISTGPDFMLLGMSHLRRQEEQVYITYKQKEEDEENVPLQQRSRYRYI